MLMGRSRNSAAGSKMDSTTVGGLLFGVGCLIAALWLEGGHLQQLVNLPVARVAMAVFNNPGGLERAGNNLFRESVNSGVANIGKAQTGGRGSISSGYLEMSNADIGNEFTNLIVTQRGFQANTRIVSTVDEMLQDVLQMKR